jgi:arylsulfatase A-like enzyme
MPSTAITISREQRDPLHRLVTQHISGIGDVDMKLSAGDFIAAERLGLEYSEDMRMLDDLGWDPDDERESFDLTLPPHDLMEALKRLRHDAEDGLSEKEEQRAREEADEVKAYFESARDVCGELIDALDTRGQRP